MQSRPSTDPTSWIFQANIHGTYDQPSNQQEAQSWNQCQHGSFFFFSWHRMYLYYFERILRAASGDPNLALPYWNYTDDPNLPDPDRRQLPLAFRQPADPSSNPLFVSQRAGPINSGTGYLAPGDVDYSAAFVYTNFDAPVGSGAASFGGPTRSNHSTSNDDFGALESTPHNVVHGDIGGLMNDPNLAARDPIFFLHHANIDRLWTRWLAQGGGRQDPLSNLVWMNTIFTFYDENGQQVRLSGKDILDTVSQLNYCYDDDPRCTPHIDLTPINYLLLDDGPNKDLTPIYYLLKSDG
jgi:tyrosinase